VQFHLSSEKQYPQNKVKQPPYKMDCFYKME
jgi:hypothetical protein